LFKGLAEEKVMNKTIFLAIASMLAAMFISCGEHGLSNNFLGETSSSSNGGQQVQAEEEPGDYAQIIVGPLLQTTWGEDIPYNNMTPLNNAGSHIRAGSAATAMAQIMKYHKYPAQGTGQNNSVSFDVNYDWDNMLNAYTSSATEQQQSAVATLMYHAGVAANMSYDGSGEVSFYGIGAALTNFFGYNKNIRILEKSIETSGRLYKEERWTEKIREQLDSGFPVIYYGTERDSGRVFIVDGYDNIGRFHINMGWNGKSNAWVFLNKLYEFTGDHRIIINIKPDEGDTTNYAPGLVKFTVTKPTAYQPAVYQNESFIASFTIYNVGSKVLPLDSVGVALVDNNGNIEAFAGRSEAGRSIGINMNDYYSYSPRCQVPGTVRPGKYHLRIFFKLKGEDWKLAEFPENVNDIPNSIDFTIAAGEAPDMGGYGFALEGFSSAKTSVSKNEQFNVIVKLVNATIDFIPGGQIRALLFDMNDNMVTDIGVKGIERVNSEASQNITLNCSVPASVEPGKYRLKIDFKPTNQLERRMISFSLPNVSNSIDLEVLSSSANVVINDKGNDINNYRTVTIDNQTWMAENLNYNVRNSLCFNNQESNCEKYGRLYDWAAAMALPYKCNSTRSTTDSDCAIKTPYHQGVCPSGWHIPSANEWDKLFKFAKGADNSSNATREALKATSGWNEVDGNGTDSYGFSALPGGYGDPNDGYFNNAGSNGASWWTSTESSGALGAYYSYLTSARSDLSRSKELLLSVRCIKDTSEPGEIGGSEFERRVLELTNIERAKNGLSPLLWHNGLADVARAHSADMMLNDMTGHTGSDGSTPGQRVARANLANVSWRAENCAYGQRSPETVVEGWMNSDVHRANILRTDATHLGVGFVQWTEGVRPSFPTYWTQVFAEVR
jgi:uncharacterized protein (TIGR02145 family)